MIVYQLTCAQGHSFEGWFSSAEAFDKQAASGQLQCPTCSTTEVTKALSAPHVHTGVSRPPAAAKSEGEMHREAVAELRNFILATTEDVGRKFAEIARRIHYREEDARNIRGVVTPEEAEELREEGVEAIAISPGILPSEEVH
jgi:hypothetical protein